MYPQKRRLLTGKKFKNQYSYLFDGSDEYINIDSVLTPLANTTVGTWSCWVKPIDATPTGSEMILSFGDKSVNETINYFISSDGFLRSQCISAGTTQWVLSTDNAAFSDNTWAHIVMVFSGETRLYINGSDPAQAFIITTNKSSWFNDLTGLDNGRMGDYNITTDTENLFFNGNIDEVGFWDIDLSPTQIQEIYNSGKPKDLLKHSASNNLVSYFRMGDGDSFSEGNFTLIDKKGTNNGTSVNLEFSDKKLDTP